MRLLKLLLFLLLLFLTGCRFDATAPGVTLHAEIGNAPPPENLELDDHLAP